MSSKKARVDILIPTYNREQYIKPCIDSILNQTYKDINIIIYDDGSTDNTEAIIKEYQATHKNIKYIKSKENRGVGFARNILLESSTADYLMWQDSDDISHEKRVEESLGYMDWVGADILFTGLVFFKDGNSHRRSKRISKVDISKYTSRDGLYNNMNFATAFFSKELKGYKFDEKLGKKEDVVWITKLIERRVRFGYIEAPLYYCRRHKDRLTYTK